MSMDALRHLVSGRGDLINSEKYGLLTAWERRSTVPMMPYSASSLIVSHFANILDKGGDPEIVEVTKHLASFSGAAGEAFSHWVLFWSITSSVHDMIRTFSRPTLNEEPHNAAFFAHLASNIWTYSLFSAPAVNALKVAPGSHTFYWADYTKGNVETGTGADFMTCVGLDREHVALALFQAKKSKNGKAAVDQMAGTRGIRQIECLLETEGSFYPGVKPHQVHPLLSSWCYYVFWHDADSTGMLPPTVRSVRSVYSEGKGAGWVVDTLRDCGEFGTMLSLFLPEQKPNEVPRFGIVVKRQSVKKLLRAMPSPPKNFIGITPYGKGWSLAYWHDLIKDCGYEEVMSRDSASISNFSPPPIDRGVSRAKSVQRHAAPEFA